MGRKKKVPDRMAALAAVSQKFKHWAPAHTVLSNVVAQPTIFPQFNVATQVGGWPLQRPCLIHGPSSHGKTSFLHGLGSSFLRAGHFYCLVDAEMTTPAVWLQQLMQQWSTAPGFQALRPKSYEQTCDAVRSAAEVMAEARLKQELPDDVTMLFGIDSIRKLVPERLMEKIAKHGADHKKGSIDGAGGRAAQYKAALNAQWLDELVPLLHHANCAMAFIGREAENTERMGPFDKTWKLTGGKALYFDSSLVVRVVLNGITKKGDAMAGERHRLEIHKTKVSAKENRVVVSHFHTSNGSHLPIGFDRGRDVLEMGVESGVIEKKGAKYVIADTGECLPDTEAEAAAYLLRTDDAREHVEALCQSAFVPMEIDMPADTASEGIVTEANG